MKKSLLILGTAAFLAASVSSHALVRYFEASLAGAQEVPGPGDPDGSGLARLWIDDANLTIIWDITAADILLPLTGAHIHAAPAGVAGPVVVNFSAQFTGGPLFDADLAAVLANPSGYYVNLHNTDHPAGAIRGQLRPVPVPEVTSPFLLAMMGFIAVAAGARFRGGSGAGVSLD